MSQKIDYEYLVDSAMRIVVFNALREAENNGALPGEHYFYITFATQYPGVQISQGLREKYTNEMTIALQHQLRLLSVYYERFEVNLSFGGVEERLIIPFGAVTRFMDPHVSFSIEMDIDDKQKFASMAQASDSMKPQVEEKIKLYIFLILRIGLRNSYYTIRCYINLRFSRCLIGQSQRVIGILI